MSSIEEIKARLDILDIVSETVQLKRSGKNYTGFCPFHSNTRTPAFVVWPETGTWRCFGQCNEGGDIFKFVMKREGWDFPETLRHLADKAGIQLRPPSPEEEIQKEEHQRLRGLLEEASAFYRHQLINTEAGKPALDYLHSRGITDQTIELFELGFAPDSWDTAANHFLEKGYTQEDLIEAGLVSERDSGGTYDRFRNRVMFPIRDDRKRMAGFGARALDPNEPAKYLNSPQTVLFDKSQLLYGLDKARKSIRKEDQVVIVEGYMGVILPYQEGYTNLVAQMGTALTQQQLRMLKRLTRRMVLALDSDAAGANATMRGLQMARETLDRETELRFDARGLLRHEGRLQADIRVTTLPEGMDPDDVVNKDTELLKKLVEDAKPIVVHVMETLAANQDINDPKVKIEIAQQVMPLIQDLPSSIERDTYIQQLARLLKVDERALLAEYRPATTRRPARRRRRKPEPAAAPVEVDAIQAQIAQPIRKLEEHCLSIIIRHPELIHRVNRALQENKLARISTNDFYLTNHQEIFKVSLDSLNQDHMEPVDFALDNLPYPLLDYTDRILSHSKGLNPQDERILEDLLRSVLRLRDLNLRQTNNQLRYLMAAAQEEGELVNEEYQQTVQKNSTILLNIQKALTRKRLPEGT